jgi:hypothetical protein
MVLEIFSQKMEKISENSDHNICPWLLKNVLTFLLLVFRSSSQRDDPQQGVGLEGRLSARVHLRGHRVEAGGHPHLVDQQPADPPAA